MPDLLNKYYCFFGANNYSIRRGEIRGITTSKGKECEEPISKQNIPKFKILIGMNDIRSFKCSTVSSSWDCPRTRVGTNTPRTHF